MRTKNVKNRQMQLMDCTFSASVGLVSLISIFSIVLFVTDLYTPSPRGVTWFAAHGDSGLLHTDMPRRKIQEDVYL